MAILIPQSVIDLFPDRFLKAADIEKFFLTFVGKHYLTWFNETLAGKGPWEKVKKLVDTPVNRARFTKFWNEIPVSYRGATAADGSISLMQFTALMSIIANETRGEFVPITEAIGIPGHPGLAYPFDRIKDRDKASYNTSGAGGLGNKTAFECFNNPFFLAAHGTMPPASLRRTTDPVWKGDVYPQATTPTAANLAITGFIMQADFMKFRGRGLIQTTGRGNYLEMIRFIQGYTGSDGVILTYKSRWAGLDPDRIAFETRNEDWDELYRNSNLEVACKAIQLYNHGRGSKNFLNLSTEEAVLNGALNVLGSLRRMGKKISGGTAYAHLFHERVAEVMNTLARMKTPAPAPPLSARAGRGR